MQGLQGDGKALSFIMKAMTSHERIQICILNRSLWVFGEWDGGASVVMK